MSYSLTGMAVPAVSSARSDVSESLPVAAMFSFDDVEARGEPGRDSY